MNLNILKRQINAIQADIIQLCQHWVEYRYMTLLESQLNMVALRLEIITRQLEIYRLECEARKQAQEQSDAEYYEGMGDYLPPGWEQQ
mmetsp:Transcript_17512/g.15675  ORF Transcript_17512/g.15675 Transcript_17512/m.15675 type:complete len:88 (-) Transcript_17512:105-368(-)